MGGGAEEQGAMFLEKQLMQVEDSLMPALTWPAEHHLTCTNMLMSHLDDSRPAQLFITNNNQLIPELHEQQED